MIFDTNVWLIINGPYSDPKDARLRRYSGFYRDALEAGAEIHLPQMVASEFINRSIRWQADAADWDGKGKIHRHPDYPQWLQNAADDLYHIADTCVLCDDAFHSVNIDDCLNEAGNFSIDFNDVLLAYVCRNRGCSLVTDDGDYRWQKELSIFSANRKILEV